MNSTHIKVGFPAWKEALKTHGYTLIDINQIAEGMSFEDVDRMLETFMRNPKIILLSNSYTKDKLNGIFFFWYMGRTESMCPNNITTENLHRSLANLLFPQNIECPICLTSDDRIFYRCRGCRNAVACMTCWCRLVLMKWKEAHAVCCPHCRILLEPEGTKYNGEVTNEMVEKMRDSLIKAMTDV